MRYKINPELTVDSDGQDYLILFNEVSETMHILNESARTIFDFCSENIDESSALEKYLEKYLCGNSEEDKHAFTMDFYECVDCLQKSGIIIEDI